MSKYKKFSSVEEIENYLSGDVIQCLECGKLCKLLSYTHLKAHNMTMDEYKDKYGIPYNYPLAVKSFRKAQSDSAKDNIDHFNKIRKSPKAGIRGKRRVSQYEKDQLRGRIKHASSFKDEGSVKRTAEKLCVLTEDQVIFIIKNSGEYSLTDFSLMFDVSNSVISRIKEIHNLKFPRRKMIRGADGRVIGSISKIYLNGIGGGENV